MRLKKINLNGGKLDSNVQPEMAMAGCFGRTRTERKIAATS
jgi:hypothetical protein